MKKRKRKYLNIEIIIRNTKGNEVFHSVSLIPDTHPDYNAEIDRYELPVKHAKTH